MRPEPADLVITNARVLDVETGVVAGDRTVVISEGRIRRVQDGGRGTPEAARTLDAGGGLLTPGLVDVHGHLAYVLGGSAEGAGGASTVQTILRFRRSSVTEFAGNVPPGLLRWA